LEQGSLYYITHYFGAEFRNLKTAGEHDQLPYLHTSPSITIPENQIHLICYALEYVLESKQVDHLRSSVEEGLRSVFHGGLVGRDMVTK